MQVGESTEAVCNDYTLKRTAISLFGQPSTGPQKENARPMRNPVTMQLLAHSCQCIRHHDTRTTTTRSNEHAKPQNLRHNARPG